MATENLQTWKVPFEAEFWRSELVHATLLGSIKIGLGNLDIYLKPGSKERVDGHFFMTVNSPDNGKNFAESEIEFYFAEFKKTLRLHGIRSEITRKRIEPTEPRGATITISKSLTIQYKILDKPVPLTYDESKSISQLYDKIQDHESKDTISNILNLVCFDTSDDAESFFYRWISFNLAYSYLKDNSNEQDSIKNFAHVFSSYDAGSSLVIRYGDLFNALTQENLRNQKKDNFSKRLQDALDDDNAEDIWKYAFLCIYSIRNQFFHRHKKSAHFEKLSEFLADVVIIALKEIFHLK